MSGYCPTERGKMKKLHYITAVTHNRESIFNNETACEIFFDQLREIKMLFPFKLFGYVLMPDHFNMLVRPHDGDAEKFLLRLRGLSARKIIDKFKADGFWNALLPLKVFRKRKHRFAVWQPKALVVDIFFRDFFEQKLNYIHMNPVRAGLCKHPSEWKWSSFNAYHGGESPIEVDSPD